MDWDSLFMNMVYLVSMKSKDENTRVGAVIVGLDNEVRSVGYNGFPRGINDNVPERQQRPEKYYWFAHAECNSVYNAALCGVAIKGCRMYTNGIPCTGCAHAVINSGIKEVIVDKRWDDHNQWKDQSERTLIMFNESGIKVRFWEGESVKITGLKNKEIIS